MCVCVGGGGGGVLMITYGAVIDSHPCVPAKMGRNDMYARVSPAQAVFYEE